ncbi:MAG TPA: hypothetical protein VG798_04000 [Rhizomicrobium sp.]|nr:hypothetical protein [Rhizomicrobium sp.]
MAVSAKPKTHHAYHVGHKSSLDWWDVVDEDGRIIAHSHDEAAAIDLAIREARHAHGRGEDVIVCAEQPDGSFRLAWSSDHG